LFENATAQTPDFVGQYYVKTPENIMFKSVLGVVFTPINPGGLIALYNSGIGGL
jgi:hypothetical protein